MRAFALCFPLCGCNVHKTRKSSCRWHHLISSLLGYICFESGKRWWVGKTTLRVLFCVALRGKLKCVFCTISGRCSPIIHHPPIMISSNILNYSLLCYTFSHSNPRFLLVTFLLQTFHLPLDIFGSLHAGSGELS